MKIDVLNDGYVQFVDMLGDDTRPAVIARISHNSVGSVEDDKRLIFALMKMKHYSTFEHVVFTFYTRAPIFVARQWFRHRIGSFMEKSGRYTKLERSYYAAETRDKQLPDAVKREIDKSFDYYEEMLKEGYDKEVARIVLPLGTYTEFYWTVNVRSLMNFLELRVSAQAQFETQKYAEAIAKIFERKCPTIYKAFMVYYYTGDILQEGGR